MNATIESTLPKFVKIDSNAADKAAVQELRKRFSATEKQIVTSLLSLAAEHPARLLHYVSSLQAAKGQKTGA